MTKKIKIILSTLLIALAIGYTVLYHWAKNRFLDIYQESKQQIQAEGWTIEDSPLTFSGFPFRIIANQEKVKLTKHKNGMDITVEASMPIKLYVSLFDPLKYSFEGNIVSSATIKGAPFAQGAFGNGTVQLAYRDGKIELASLTIHQTQGALLDPQGLPHLGFQAQEVKYTEGAYSLQETNDGKILETTTEYILKDLTILGTKDGTATPIVTLKKVKANVKGKMPLTVADTLKAIFKDPASSPMAKICQDGGKVPPLKTTIDLMEKIESYGKIDLEVEHNDYIVNLDLDAKILKGTPELLLTTQVSNLNSLFDALNLDPTMRLLANGFVKKESDKSEKAKVIVKVSNGTLFLNEMEITKVPMPDWDNVVLPADVCSKYAIASTPVVAPTAPVAPLVHTPY